MYVIITLFGNNCFMHMIYERSKYAYIFYSFKNTTHTYTHIDTQTFFSLASHFFPFILIAAWKIAFASTCHGPSSDTPVITITVPLGISITIY